MRGFWKGIFVFSDEDGFTLIELLVVVVVLGILVAVLVTVMQPATQQRKAREVALRSNVEKMCLGLHGCGLTSRSAADCDTYSEAGIRSDGLTPQSPEFNGTPTNAVYILSNDVSGVPYINDSANPNDILYVTGTIDDGNPATLDCSFQCNYNFGTSTPSNPFMTQSTGCFIGVQ